MNRDVFPAGTDASRDPQHRAYRRARGLVRALRGWYIHLTVYLAVNVLLWARLLTMSPGDGVSHRAFGGMWPLGPSLFWGLGLAIHGVVVWLRVSRRGRDWEADKIRQFMANDRDAGYPR